MLNEPRAVPNHKQEAPNGFAKRQQTQSLPCIPPQIDRWFGSELEKRGIDPIIFGPAALFNLMQHRQHSANVPITERYNARVRVIEMLLEATNGSNSADDLSHLIDQVDLRLRQSETSLDYRSSAAEATGAPALSSSADEGFLEWGSSPKGRAAAPAGPVPAPAPPSVEHPEHAEEEGELLLNEVSDMLDQFNLEVRRGDVDTIKETAKVPVKPSAGIPAVLGRKRDESIDSGCSSFNWSSSRDSSNESSPPSVLDLDWLSVSPGGANSIWSSPSLLSSSYGASSVSSAAVGPHPRPAGNGGPAGPSPDSSWFHPQIKARMRLTSAPSFIYVDEDMPELVRHRGMGPGGNSNGSGGNGGGGGGGGKKKHKGAGAGGKVGGKHHSGHHHHHQGQNGQAQARQASPPSDSAGSGSSPSSGGSSPPASGAGAASVGGALSGGAGGGGGAAGKSSLEKSRRACSFYLRGHCKKEDCEFAHDLTKVTCKFWMTGECFKGETCPFLHGQPRSA